MGSCLVEKDICKYVSTFGTWSCISRISISCALQQVLSKHLASALRKPIDENAVDPGQPGPLVPAADPVVGDGAGDAGVADVLRRIK